jgi:hypothetical protein
LPTSTFPGTVFHLFDDFFWRQVFGILIYGARSAFVVLSEEVLLQHAFHMIISIFGLPVGHDQCRCLDGIPYVVMQRPKAGVHEKIYGTVEACE